MMSSIPTSHFLTLLFKVPLGVRDDRNCSVTSGGRQAGHPCHRGTTPIHFIFINNFPPKKHPSTKTQRGDTMWIWTDSAICIFLVSEYLPCFIMYPVRKSSSSSFNDLHKDVVEKACLVICYQSPPVVYHGHLRAELDSYGSSFTGKGCLHLGNKNIPRQLQDFLFTLLSHHVIALRKKQKWQQAVCLPILLIHIVMGHLAQQSTSPPFRIGEGGL